MATKWAIGLAACAVVLSAAFPTSAQIGRGMTAATRMWGAPVSGQLDESGQGILTFKPEQANFSIRNYYENGTSRRLLIEMGDQSFSLVNQFLAANADGRAWELLLADGEEQDRSRRPNRWQRSDERFYAELVGNRLEIRDASWEPSGKAEEEHLEAEELQPTQAQPRTVIHQPSPAGRPDELPPIGASSREVLRLLGRPSGTMNSGDRVAWYYQWGLVWLQDDHVVQID